MRITPKQQSFLDSLTCERLTFDPQNQEYIKSFRSKKGDLLVKYLLNRGWQEDTEGSLAFYVIKNQDNVVLFFFSLKCGSLFDPLNEDEIEARIEGCKQLLEIIRSSSTGDDREETLAMLEQLRSGSGLPLDQLESRLRRSIKYDTKKLEQIGGDKEQERNAKIVRVGVTHPGVELVHFCANDSARYLWMRSGMTRSMGEVLFWHFIAPIICNVQTIIGCQYAYLFAADLSQDGSLVNYYQISLNFDQPDDIGTSKPLYDFCCEFMCQKIKDIQTYRTEYFDNFNPDITDEVV